MDHEKASQKAGEDVEAVLDGTETERRMQLAQAAVWAVARGHAISRGMRAAKERAARKVLPSEIQLTDEERERADVLAAMLAQQRVRA